MSQQETAASADVAQLTFTQLLARCFRLAADPSKAADVPAGSDPVAHALLPLLSLAATRAAQLGLVSSGESGSGAGESLREVSTPALRSLFIQSLWGEAEANARVNVIRDGTAERRRRLANSKAHYTAFVQSLRALRILPASTEALLRAHAGLSDAGGSSGSGPDASGPAHRGALPPNAALAASARRRELKIALFKTERSLQSSLEQFRSAHLARQRRLRVLAAGSSSASSAAADESAATVDVFYDPLIPAGRARAVRGEDGAEDDHSEEDEREDDDEDEDRDTAPSPEAGVPKTVRAYVLLLLNLHAVRASQQLESAQQELDLLASMPEAPRAPQGPSGMQEDRRDRARDARDADWRIDRRANLTGASGPLMDDKGKPLRPFVITGSGDVRSGGAGAAAATAPGVELSARERLREQVFQPGHRLPTMSIDEYLAEEQRRGNIITGGGPAQQAALTPREQRALRAEGGGEGAELEDGRATRDEEAADEERRKEQTEWDEFKENNPKGAGNTMNRG